jgi:hypothetical protein
MASPNIFLTLVYSSRTTKNLGSFSVGREFRFFLCEMNSQLPSDFTGQNTAARQNDIQANLKNAFKPAYA